jgi:hypothetical protein
MPCLEEKRVASLLFSDYCLGISEGNTRYALFEEAKPSIPRRGDLLLTFWEN